MIALVTTLAVWEAVSPSGHSGGPARGITLAQYNAVKLGESAGSVTHRLGGRGEDALNFGGEGVATEPTDATCAYYGLLSASAIGSFQFCFRHHKLISKTHPSTTQF